MTRLEIELIDTIDGELVTVLVDAMLYEKSSGHSGCRESDTAPEPDESFIMIESPVEMIETGECLPIRDWCTHKVITDEIKKNHIQYL